MDARALGQEPPSPAREDTIVVRLEASPGGGPDEGEQLGADESEAPPHRSARREPHGAPKAQRRDGRAGRRSPPPRERSGGRRPAARARSCSRGSASVVPGDGSCLRSRARAASGRTDYHASAADGASSSTRPRKSRATHPQAVLRRRIVERLRRQVSMCWSSRALRVVAEDPEPSGLRSSFIRAISATDRGARGAAPGGAAIENSLRNTALSTSPGSRSMNSTTGRALPRAAQRSLSRRGTRRSPPPHWIGRSARPHRVRERRHSRTKESRLAAP
jgi:hypothetical protein